MKLTWLGHSCFAVESGGYRVVLDPYYVESYPPLHTSANEVLCSHHHRDHDFVEAVELTPRKDSPFTVQTVEAFHDDKGGALRGTNTIHVLTAEGLRVVHLGDLGHELSGDQLAPLRTIDRDDRVPVADSSDVASVFAHRFADLRGKLRQIAHGRIFLENDLAVLFRIDLQRVAFADTECPADLLGDDDAAEVVPLCQVGAKKIYKLSEKPLISMALGFPDGATMRLRGFDRLCYFRSKFDRFTPK